MPGIEWPWNVPGICRCCFAEAVPDGGVPLAGHGDGKGGHGGKAAGGVRAGDSVCASCTHEANLVHLCGVT